MLTFVFAFAPVIAILFGGGVGDALIGRTLIRQPLVAHIAGYLIAYSVVAMIGVVCVALGAEVVFIVIAFSVIGWTRWLDMNQRRDNHQAQWRSWERIWQLRDAAEEEQKRYRWRKRR